MVFDSGNYRIAGYFRRSKFLFLSLSQNKILKVKNKKQCKEPALNAGLNLNISFGAFSRILDYSKFFTIRQV